MGRRATFGGAGLLAGWALALLGCTSRGLMPGGPDAADAVSHDGAPAAFCCPIETPGCSCFGYGGAANDGSCPKICDAGGDNWSRTTDESGCPVLVQSPPGGGCLAPPDGPPGVAASIKMSKSTNSPEIEVVVRMDGSADRTLNGPPGVLSVAPFSYPPASPDVETFLADLAAVGDVSAIATGQCAKSVSFGTNTTVSTGAATSGDLQCLVNPTTAARALAQDCQTLLGTAAR